jgi:hypothetical protein
MMAHRSGGLASRKERSMITRRAVPALVLLLSCGRATNHDPARYGTVHIALVQDFSDPASEPWSNHWIDVANQAMSSFEAIGPDVVHDDTADVKISVSVGSGSASGAICFRLTRPAAQEESACNCGPSGPAIPCGQVTDDDVRHAVQFLIGRVEGMSVICTASEAAHGTSGCSPVGNGDAVLNTPFVEPHVQIEPTMLDIAEFRRVHP